MSLLVSVYLDGFRILAALIVFLSHTAGTRLTGFLLPEAASFSVEAVAAFFVLSGFVIGYVVDTRENTCLVFSTNRLARLYSVAIPAILVTLAFDAVGHATHPDLYNGAPVFWHPPTLTNLLASLLFATEFWSGHVQLGTNEPYWSLGFEAWYYIVFALFMFLRGIPRVIAVLLWFVLVGPRVAAAFPVWLMGYAAYFVGKKYTAAPWLGIVLVVITALTVLPYHLEFGQPLLLHGPFSLSYGTLRGYAYYYVLALMIGLNFAGISWSSAVVPDIPNRIVRPIRWLAGATFTFYLMHRPAAVLLAAVSPWPPGSAITRMLVIGGTPLAILLLAEIGERRKAWWRGLFTWLVARATGICGGFQARLWAVRPM